MLFETEEVSTAARSQGFPDSEGAANPKCSSNKSSFTLTVGQQHSRTAVLPSDCQDRNYQEMKAGRFFDSNGRSTYNAVCIHLGSKTSSRLKTTERKRLRIGNEGSNARIRTVARVDS
jgi:hypothetical protein